MSQPETSRELPADDGELGNRYEGATMLRPGLLTDSRMVTDHRCRWYKKHVESPKRLDSVLEKLSALGLLERMTRLEFNECPQEVLQLFHSREYVEKMKDTQFLTDRELHSFSKFFDSVYVCQKTYKTACLAVGAVVEATRSVVTKRCNNAIALVRPPGHHAMRDEANGFCIFNNVGIAAQYALKHLNVKRVLIVDWDVHYGQGIQQAFLKQNNVLCVSIHRYEKGEFWPYMSEADCDQIGDREGRGYNVNIPLNVVCLRDADYVTTFHHVIMPIAVEYGPDLVLVSAGFDAAVGCPEGHMLLTPHIFGYFTQLLRSVAGGRLVIALEGGYCLPSLSCAASYVVRALLGDPLPVPEMVNRPIRSSVVQVLRQLSKGLMDYWSCMAAFQQAECLNQHLDTASQDFQMTEMVDITGHGSEISIGDVSNSSMLAEVLKVNSVLESGGLRQPSRFRLAILLECSEYTRAQVREEMQSKIPIGYSDAVTFLPCIEADAPSRQPCILTDTVQKEMRVLTSNIKGLIDAIVSDQMCHYGLMVHDRDNVDWPCAMRSFSRLLREHSMKRVLCISMSGEKFSIRLSMLDSVEMLTIIFPITLQTREAENPEQGATDSADKEIFAFRSEWPKKCPNDSDRMFVFHNIILPLAYCHKPDFVMVELRCMERSMTDSEPALYGYMASTLLGLASGRVLMINNIYSPEKSRELVGTQTDAIVSAFLGTNIPLTEEERKWPNVDEETKNLVSSLSNALPNVSEEDVNEQWVQGETLPSYALYMHSVF